MNAAERDAEPHSPARARGGAWIFRGLLAALLGVMLLPLLSLALHAWKIDSQRRLLASIDDRAWAVIEDGSQPDPADESWIAEVLGEEWDLPRTDIISLDHPFAPNVNAKLNSISQLVFLKSLEIPGAPITDADVQLIARLRRLQRLDLTATDVTDSALIELRTLSKLQELDLSATTITDRGIASLADIESLTLVRLRCTTVSTAAVQRLQKARPDLEIDYLPAKGDDYLRAVRSIWKRGGYAIMQPDGSGSTIRLNGNPSSGDWRDFDWETLKHITDVAAVNIEQFDRPDEILAALDDFPDIRVISITRSPVNSALMERIGKRRGLEHLLLDDCELKPEFVALLQDLAALKSLTLSKVPIGPAEIRTIAALPELRRVELRNCEFAEGVFRSLETPPNWEELDLLSGNLTDQDMQDLAKWHSLQSLGLIGNRALTDASVDALLSLPNLKDAAVGASAVTTSGEERLMTELLQRKEVAPAPIMP